MLLQNLVTVNQHFSQLFIFQRTFPRQFIFAGCRSELCKDHVHYIFMDIFVVIHFCKFFFLAKYKNKLVYSIMLWVDFCFMLHDYILNWFYSLERRAVRRISGYRELEDENFPEPKPDYSDDDFELRPKKSPKKSPIKGRRGTITEPQCEKTCSRGFSTK